MIESQNSKNIQTENPFLKKEKVKKGFNISFFNKVSNKDIVIFTRSLSVLSNAGVPLVRSLKILSGQTVNPEMKVIIESLSEGIESGTQLSVILSRHPKVFNKLYVNLVTTGEISGTLDKSLSFVADQLEKDYELRRKVRAAMVYPTFIISFMVVIMVVLFAFVMPKMLAILQETSVELPFQTKILLGVSNVFSNFWWLIILVFALIPVALKMIKENPKTKFWWDGFLLKLPKIGTIIRNVYVERFSRNFAVLVKGGIPIVKGLKVTAEGMTNSVYEKLILSVAQKVENGNSLAKSFAEYPNEIPALVMQMIDVGEQTSQVDEILLKIGTFYEREVDESVGSLTQLLEPIIIMILGAMVAIIVSGILLPMYSVINQV